VMIVQAIGASTAFTQWLPTEGPSRAAIPEAGV